MSTYGQHLDISMQAMSDLSSYQWYLVESGSTANRVQRATSGSNHWPLGVLLDDPSTAGDAAAVAFAGEIKARACADSATVGGISAGGAITVQSRLGWNSLGEVIKAPTSACAHCFGLALEALASGSGNIRILIQPGIFNTNS